MQGVALMAAPDLPVHLDEALRALDTLHANLRGVQVLRQFLESLNETRPEAVPPAALDDYVALEHAYARGARCATMDGHLIVITRAALLDLLRKYRSIES